MKCNDCTPPYDCPRCIRENKIKLRTIYVVKGMVAVFNTELEQVPGLQGPLNQERTELLLRLESESTKWVY